MKLYDALIQTLKLENDFIDDRGELRPTFYSDQSDFVLTLPNLNYDRKNGEVLSSPKVPQSSPKFSKVHQTSPKFPYVPNQLIKQLRVTPSATLVDLGTALGVSPRMIKRYLNILKEQNRITRIGSNRKGYWQINEIS